MTIRRQPRDFLVSERLSGVYAWGLRPTPPASGPAHAVYELEKTSLSTPEAIEALAKLLSVRAGIVDYAGLKDKHAATRQAVSVPLSPAPPGGERATPPRSLSGRQWSATLKGYATQPVTAAAIDGNAFEIVVRDLTQQACDEMDQRAALLRDTGSDAAEAAAPSLLVVNYFGDQRFGSARHGAGFAGRRLIEGDFDGALRLLIGTPSRKDAGKTREFRRIAAEHWGKWDVMAKRLPRGPERAPIEALAAGASAKEAFSALPAFIAMMSVEAYQSHLWNATARRLAETIAQREAERAGEAAVIEAPDEFGVMLFPARAMVDDAWRTLAVPILAAKSVLEDPWKDAAAAALVEEGISVEQLRIPGLRRPFFGEAMRPLFVEAAKFTLGVPAPDDVGGREGRLMRTLSFELPKGAYATVVLRALGQ